MVRCSVDQCLNHITHVCEVDCLCIQRLDLDVHLQCAPLGGAVAPRGLQAEEVRPDKTKKGLPFNPASLNRIGCSTRDKPTYVYPAELKEMVRAAFPNDVCDYEDPCHGNVVAITMDDLKRVAFS